jgi:hypothetical protein
VRPSHSTIPARQRWQQRSGVCTGVMTASADQVDLSVACHLGLEDALCGDANGCALFGATWLAGFRVSLTYGLGKQVDSCARSAT